MPCAESLIASMDAPELVAAAAALDTDDLAELAPDPEWGGREVKKLSIPKSASSYGRQCPGGHGWRTLMDFEMVEVRALTSLEVVMRYLRRFDELATDQVFVVDQDKLLGVLPTNVILVTHEDKLVSSDRDDRAKDQF